jgi:hypothetical protein
MKILLKESQLESAFDKLMKKHEYHFIEDFDLSYLGVFHKYLPYEHNVKLFFETELDAFPETNNWYALYDPHFTHKEVNFSDKEINEDDFPILYLTEGMFREEKSMLGDMFYPLYKQWFEKTFNLPVKRLI